MVKTSVFNVTDKEFLKVCGSVVISIWFILITRFVFSEITQDNCAFNIFVIKAYCPSFVKEITYRKVLAHSVIKTIFSS